VGPTLAALGYLDDGKSPPSGQDVRRLLLVEIEWQDARSARYHAPSTFRRHGSSDFRCGATLPTAPELWKLFGYVPHVPGVEKL